MAVVVAFVSQKGGTGKSTLARALGAVAAHAGLKVKIADLDAGQQTVVQWKKARDENRIVPRLQVHAFKNIGEAIATAENDELVIVDTSAGANRRVLDVAQRADLIVQPSSGSLDDLRPTVLLFHELVDGGVPKERLVVALCRTLSDVEEDAARGYLKKAGYEALPGSIPERSSYREAQNRGQTLTETNQNALNERAKDLIAGLFKKVMAQLVKRDRAAKTQRRRQSE